MDIISLLPLLRGWEYRPVEYEPPAPPIEVSPGNRLELIEEEIDVSGWFLSGGLMVDNPDATVTIFTDIWSVDASPYGLYDYGLTIQPKLGAWCPRYDTANDIYTMQFTLPWMPYNNRRHVFFSNPVVTHTGALNTTVKLYSYTFAIIQITDIEVFQRSLRILV